MQNSDYFGLVIYIRKSRCKMLQYWNLVVAVVFLLVCMCMLLILFSVTYKNCKGNGEMGHRIHS